MPEFPPPPSGFQWDTGPFETSTPTFVSKGAQRLGKKYVFGHFCLGTPIPGWQSLIPGLWELPGGLHIENLAFICFPIKSIPHETPLALSVLLPERVLFRGKGQVLGIALALSSLFHNAKIATQAQNAKIWPAGSFLGLASRFKLLIWRNVKKPSRLRL